MERNFVKISCGWRCYGGWKEKRFFFFFFVGLIMFFVSVKDFSFHFIPSNALFTLPLLLPLPIRVYFFIFQLLIFIHWTWKSFDRIFFFTCSLWIFNSMMENKIITRWCRMLCTWRGTSRYKILFEVDGK